MKQCPSCGVSNNDDMMYCASCGNPLADAPAPIPVQEARPITLGTKFVASDEYIVATLANSAVDNILSGEGITVEDAVCTNKRFYYKQKRGIINVIRRDEIVDLKDITGTKIAMQTAPGLLVLAIIIAVLSIMIGIATDTAPFLLPFALVFLLLYFILKKAHLRVEYAGGFIYFSVKKYGLQQITAFQKGIHFAKEIQLREELR